MLQHMTNVGDSTCTYCFVQYQTLLENKEKELSSKICYAGFANWHKIDLVELY